MRREEVGPAMGHRADTASYYWTTFLRLDPKLATAFSAGPVAIVDPQAHSVFYEYTPKNN
jgi:hypothetical protein